MAGSTSKIVEIDTAGLRRRREPRRQIQSLIDQRRLGCGRLLTHVTQNRRFGARSDDRILDALDPDLGSVAIPPFVPEEGLKRIDVIGSREFAEAERDHPRF